MTTFAKWLSTQENRTDATGWLAAQWRDALHRPRVSTPSGIEKHLAEVHAGDETYIGQLASAVRIATDAYHHRDDPPGDDQQLATVTAGEMTPAEHLAANEQLARDQDQVEEAAERAFDAQFDQIEPEALPGMVAFLMHRTEQTFALVRSIAATIGLNVDDDSIDAMCELWSGAPDAAAEIAAAEHEPTSLAAQLAEPTPPQAFATWWGTADHSAAQADDLG